MKTSCIALLVTALALVAESNADLVRARGQGQTHKRNEIQHARRHNVPVAFQERDVLASNTAVVSTQHGVIKGGVPANVMSTLVNAIKNIFGLSGGVAGMFAKLIALLKGTGGQARIATRGEPKLTFGDVTGVAQMVEGMEKILGISKPVAKIIAKLMGLVGGAAAHPSAKGAASVGHVDRRDSSAQGSSIMDMWILQTIVGVAEEALGIHPAVSNAIGGVLGSMIGADSSSSSSERVVELDAANARVQKFVLASMFDVGSIVKVIENMLGIDPAIADAFGQLLTALQGVVPAGASGDATVPSAPVAPVATPRTKPKGTKPKPVSEAPAVEI